MFTKKSNDEADKLNKIIDELQVHILSKECDAEEYAQLLAHLQALYQLKEKNTSNDRISANTKAIIAANLAGIILILSFEKAHVVTSKALSFIMKLK